MAEERTTISEPRDADPPPTTHTTIIHEGEPRRSSGAGWLIAIVLLIAVVAGIYLFSQTSGSEAVKNNAIAGAAEEVGNAASQVGNAAQDAANSIKD